MLNNSKIEKFKLGEALLKGGFINSVQLDSALSLQRGTGRKLGRILVEQKYVTEEDISKVIAKQLGIDFVSLKDLEIKLKETKPITEIQARRFKVLPIRENDVEVIIGMSDPTDLKIQDEIGKIVKKDIRVICLTETDVLNGIDFVYSIKKDIGNIASELERDIQTVNNLSNNTSIELSVDDAPVIKLLQNIIDDAFKSGISDIHVEPQKDKTMIRFRKDGELTLYNQVGNQVASRLIARLKIISNLDISEKRLPQDGRFQLMANNQSVDVRLSIIPEYFGEAAVLRLLSQSNVLMDLDKVDMPVDILNGVRKILSSQEGMLLVVGPTGSGKTTTLYAAISDINDITKKIITIEDPVEYQIPLINQIQVNDKIDFSFARILRTVLRQDPDVILVGEIRDTETAQIALRGAITGHLILSTLHTKDAVSAPVRLIDMGVPHYMVASALEGVLSQRLLRKNCEHCSEDHLLSEKDLIWVKEYVKEQFGFKKGSGCNKCNNTGYNGRLSVYEFLNIDDELKKCLYGNDINKFTEMAVNKMNGRKMIDNVLSSLKSGVLSVEEAKKIIS